LEKGPDKCFIAFDSGTSKRKDLEPTYKRGRASPPEDYWGIYEGLMLHLHNHFASDVSLVVSPGLEADDCIATVAKAAVSHGKRCVMMTQDKDCRQCLVAGKVTMQRRGKDAFGKACWGFLTCADAEKDWDCRVDQFVDYQILTGDEVDNIKGCRGIGSTRASVLLKEYGSIEKMKFRATFPEMPVEVERTLLKYLKNEEAVARQLVTLKTDCQLFDPVFETEVFV
jgi:DNA polymerase-1